MVPSSVHALNDRGLPARGFPKFFEKSLDAISNFAAKGCPPDDVFPPVNQT
jgi:hypothetical protein